MNTLVAVSIAPFGIGDELAAEVAEVVKVIRHRDCRTDERCLRRLKAPGTKVMQVVKEATFVLAKKGIRTEVVLKADVRPGFTNMMTSKVEKINEILGGENEHPQKA